MPEFLTLGPKSAKATFLFAHGAAVPMDGEWMTTIAEGIADAGIEVVRFEFGYMAARRLGEQRQPPAAAVLIEEYRAAIAALAPDKPLIIGGKSMGGRIAAAIANELFLARTIRGLVCLGYPFHAPGQGGSPELSVLRALKVPTLICQGDRDPFGTEPEVSQYELSSSVQLHWLRGGDHDFRPLKVSGRTYNSNRPSAIRAVVDFIDSRA